MSDDGNLELLKFDDGDMIFMFHDIVDDFVVDPKEQKQVADALYQELGLGWLPYPENKPEDDGQYWITYKTPRMGAVTIIGGWFAGQWHFQDEVSINDSFVLAYQLSPSPYQP